MTRSSRSVASPRVVSIGDFRAIAQRRLPKSVFDYLDGGAEGEVTLRENCRVYEDVTFRPRHAVAFANCDLRTRVLGFDLALPFLLAPVGYSRLMHPVGEVGAARAAGNAGTAYIPVSYTHLDVYKRQATVATGQFPRVGLSPTGSAASFAALVLALPFRVA